MFLTEFFFVVNERVIAVTPYVTAVCTCLNHHMDVHDVVQCALAILAILCENGKHFFYFFIHSLILLLLSLFKFLFLCVT